jgi:manganese/iron transport system ATP-binding protein
MPLTTWMHKPEAHQIAAPVVEFNHVTVRYEGNAPALDDITFQLMRGERIAIVGPNGAGKSTLFKLIAGIMAPTTGEVKVYGYGASGHICVGYVPQRTQVDLNFPVTVADVVMMGRVAKLGLFRHAGRADWRLVHDSLERVGMTALAGRQIGELSGGQQQRVFIARAIVQEAELLLMDEPLNGLDVPSQEAIFEIVDHLRAAGMTVLVSTHDLHLAADRFDRLMLLKHRLLGLGTGAQVLTPANLRIAYGAQMTVVPDAAGALVFGDTCCEGHDEEEEHSHA